VIPATLPIFSVAELEKKAEAFLRSAVGEILIPVDVDLLIESRADADLDYWPGLQ
jgi:hypothetical protein